jgi:putative transferase (TIGR04331 family)
MTKCPVLKRDHQSPGSRAVMVMGNEATQVNSLSSSALSSQFLDYMGDQVRFMESLDQTVRRALLVRLSRWDGDWCFGQRLADRLQDVELDDGGRPISELLREARLYITTNNGTTFLESIFLDVPTVMFWDTEMWGLTELARPAFDRLSAVGVFFDDPIKAAAHVSEVWDDVGSWWNDPDVREAVEAFSVQFCRRSPDVVDEVRRVLVEVGGRR